MTRLNGRAADALRPTTITPNVLMHAEGSVLIEVGQTRVICAASIEDRVYEHVARSQANRRFDESVEVFLQ